jgi:hypothetical protein
VSSVVFASRLASRSRFFFIYSFFSLILLGPAPAPTRDCPAASQHLPGSDDCDQTLVGLVSHLSSAGSTLGHDQRPAGQQGPPTARPAVGPGPAPSIGYYEYPFPATFAAVAPHLQAAYVSPAAAYYSFSGTPVAYPHRAQHAFLQPMSTSFFSIPVSSLFPVRIYATSVFFLPLFVFFAQEGVHFCQLIFP